MVTVPVAWGPWLCHPPARHVPALGHGVLLVHVALERQRHLLLELVHDVPLGDAGVVWGQRGGDGQRGQGDTPTAAPAVPTW